MFVSDILSQKGALVFSVTPATTVAEVAKQLSVRRIGSVLILNEHSSVVGIVSERDLVRALAAHGDKAMELEARQVMTRDVVTCHPDDSIEEVMQAMTKGRFRHLPVVDRGELLGLVSIGDVVKARLEETEHETEALKAYIVARLTRQLVDRRRADWQFARMPSDSLPLQGKVALVTGAGRNIGRAIALTLARDGASVLVNGRADKAAVDAVVHEIVAAGGKALAAMGDVSDPQVPPRLADQAAKAFGGVDILVSNAGLRRQTSFLDMSFEEWREILSVALDGAFLLGKAFIPQMVAKGQGGAFVAISGVSTHVGTPNRCHVSASKSGLEGLMRALAVELAPHRITCNALAPGAIETARAASAGPVPASRMNRPIPLKRFGTVDEIAAMVRLLVGPQGTFITGQTIHVNGGEHLT